MSISKQTRNPSGTTSSSQLSLPLIIKTHISITTRVRRRRINHLLLDLPNSVSFSSLATMGGLPSEGEECFFNVDVGFCGGFNEWNAQFLGECFALFF